VGTIPPFEGGDFGVGIAAQAWVWDKNVAGKTEYSVYIVEEKMGRSEVLNLLRRGGL